MFMQIGQRGTPATRASKGTTPTSTLERGTCTKDRESYMILVAGLKILEGRISRDQGEKWLYDKNARIVFLFRLGDRAEKEGKEASSCRGVLPVLLSSKVFSCCLSFFLYRSDVLVSGRKLAETRLYGKDVGTQY
ncbi:hypothetical protein Fcan01_08933 [Folsomia candida]|uniref:Uncharacterized protein n=1 Tax=Folsomia candida TaxID=158441 RepID=A0A226EDN5_FOLCA|nr:hypothetical protein Fcan01_08933 [Folsomia candida]